MHLESYLESITDDEFAQSLRKSGLNFAGRNVKNFDHMSRINGLLFGEVQSGKTAHTLSCIAASADEDDSLQTFIYLVTNSVALQQQTFKRALMALGRTFSVCDESDGDVRFAVHSMGQPRLIVLKKEPRILASWLETLSKDSSLKSSPILVIDDEADAATPNTKVNLEDESRIYSLVSDLRKLGTSSIFLQVTATPQALLLQTDESGLHPTFKNFFDPGSNYIGGDFFFGHENTKTSFTIPEDDLSVLLSTSAGDPSSGLVSAISHFIVSMALSIREGETNLNCNVHPTVSKAAHSRILLRVKDLLERFESLEKYPYLEAQLEGMRQNLNSGLESTKPITVEDVKVALKLISAINVYVVNSSEETELPKDFESGFNIIIGGNSLSRGVTFPNLQTVYYTRDAKVKNADTFWQHSRIFGYSRRRETIRIFMPASLIALFRVLQEANSKLINAVKSGQDSRISIILPKGTLRPTRKNVIDKGAYDYVLGGTNYFPPSPNQKNFDGVLGILDQADLPSDKPTEVKVDLAKDLLKWASEAPDWPTQTFISGLVAIAAHSSKQPLVLVRRGRRIGRTGTMLSPTDRALGAQLASETLITIYEVLGEAEGWRGLDFWMMNVKLPEGLAYHHVRG